MTNIPYVKQTGDRTCGAACLSMVYGSMGASVAEEEIWKTIAKRNPRGSIASTSHLMAKDAIERGYSAVVYQAMSPLRALRVCLDNGLRVIVNHRVNVASAEGHYSVVVDMRGSNVIVHDPSAGANRSLELAELLDLWRPGNETVGYVLITIGAKEKASLAACGKCRLEIPEKVACAKCGGDVELRPASALGCIGKDCRGRHWKYLCCPACDCMWNFYGVPGAGAAAAAAAPPAEPAFDPLDADSIYAELDKQFAKLKEIPDLVVPPEAQKHLDYIQAQKEPLRLALAEQAAYHRQHKERMEELAQSAQANKESLKTRQEEASKQSPPLDGDALGVALLNNLGFVR